MKKEHKAMKKKTAAIAAMLLLIAAVFAGCKGADSGKVTDNNNPVVSVTDMTSSLSATNGAADTTDTLSEILSDTAVS